MEKKQNIIQTSYTEALKTAKNSPSSGCCTTDTGTEILINSFEKDPFQTDQSISFGCYRLDDILSEKVTKGSTVIDFGSGPGHDLFLAARIVGETGRAIGVDFTDAMINEASNIAKEKGLKHVELVKSSIEKIPLEDNLADAIISNCVINLTMDKQAVFNEAFRLLKSGGQLIDADIISGGDFSEELKRNNDLWCSCIGGALTKEETVKLLEETGFVDIEIKLGQKNPLIYQGKEYFSYSSIILAKKPF